MFSRDIPSYPLDLTGQAETNKVVNEYYRRTDTEQDTIFVPLSGPYYIQSMVLTDPASDVQYVEGKDYEFFGICAEITAFVKNKEVGMAIRWLNSAVTEWYASYQVVGHFSYWQKELLYLTESIKDDDRPVFYKNIKNKPLWFPPELHGHDVRYELHAFSDLIDCVNRIRELKKNQLNPVTEGASNLIDNLSGKIAEWQNRIQSQIDQHALDVNAHGLTAAQVNLGNVDNYPTANLIETLNGSRRDRHLTMDNVDQAIRQATTSLTQLTKSGSLPLLGYGSTGFIPPAITGSFEGQGGNSFRMGFNIEPNGEALILMNRNDGRVNGLYFMSNTTSGTPVTDWKYTVYRYQHQTASDAGVNLSRILQGSNGKFLIIGGSDTNGDVRWYYTTGNGTFDPNKHILLPLPDDIVTLGGDYFSSATITSETYPDRIMLWVPQSGSSVMKGEYRNIFYDLPEGEEDKTGFQGAALPGVNVGQLCWEYSLTEKVWRRVTFTYHPAGYPDNVYTSYFYCPYRYKIVKVTADNPRLDGSSSPYGVKGYEYTFSSPITQWTGRLWGYAMIDLYDAERDVIGIKGFDSTYGYDGRAFTLEGGDVSYGILLKNRTTTDTETHFDVTNGFGLEDTLYVRDVTTKDDNYIGYEGSGRPHTDTVGRSFSNAGGSLYWIKPGVVYGAGTVTYGSYPISISRFDINGLPNFASVENWATSTSNGQPYSRQTTLYNESNTSGFTIGAHSLFYLQLDPNDVNTYGGVAYSSKGMSFRKQSALDEKGIPKKPYVNFTLYNSDVIGYPLDNKSYTFTGSHTWPYVTNIFADIPNNRREEYIKHLIGHHPYPTSGGSVSTKNANHKVATEHKVVISQDTVDIVATKIYDLADALTNTLFPHMLEQGKAQGYSIIGHNLPATYRIGFSNLASTKYEQLLICTGIVFQESKLATLMLSTCFNLTGGTLTDGVITGATITPVGKVHVTTRAEPTQDYYNSAINEGYAFGRWIDYKTTQPRDLARQMDNGKSFCVVHHATLVTVKSNINLFGTAMVVSEEGIEETWGFDQYWTSGEYRYFYHPYYGAANRYEITNNPAAASQIGYPYPRDITGKANFITDKSLRVLGNSNYLQSAYTVYIGSDQRVEINGAVYNLPARDIDLYTIDSDPSNSIYYLYMVYGSEGPEYSIVTTPLPETANRALLSIIKTNKDSIYEIENYNVFSMNGFRISSTRHGSVIPSATGSIDVAGQAKGWVDN